MKLFRIIMLFLAGAFGVSGASGQANAIINILTQNSGLVNIGGSVFLQVDIGNTGPNSSIGVYKVKAQISAPSNLVTIPPTGHQLPAGWTILSNNGSVINISNGTDIIPVDEVRTILIALQGTTLGGPSTVAGVLSFSNGIAPGSGPGILSGDNIADNISQSSVEVIPAAACNIAVNATAGTILCNGATTTLTATATGATGSVEYSLNSGAFQSGNTFTVNAVGSPYSVTAREVSNPTCSATSTAVTVSQPTAISASGSVSAPITVFGGTGSINVSATGGSGTKTYTISSGTTTNTTGASSGVFTGLLAGSYTFTATDANSCTGVTSSIVLANAAACNITVSASAGTILCNGGSTTLTATSSGANGAVEYSFNGGAYQAGNTFTVNAAGSPYVVAVREIGNTTCNATSNSVAVTQPAVLVAGSSASVAACGGTGTVTVTATGGAAPYTGVGSFQAPAGAYSYTVTDANGCTATTTGTVAVASDNVNPTITAPAALNLNTNNGCNATGVNLETPVTADNCAVASITNNAPVNFPLGATTVTWTVTDASGNTATATQVVTVTDNVKPVVYFQGTGLLPGLTGTSTTQTPYLLPAVPGVKFKSILSVNDVIGSYRMAGIPDGLGAFDNNDGTFTLLVNHEIGNTLGINRAHGSKGSFVSKWIVNKSDLSFVSGMDLMQNVNLYNPATQAYTTYNAANPSAQAIFGRFCSADLPAVSAFYNPATGFGTKERIFMNGEETNDESRQMAHIVTGSNGGTSWELPALGKASWENSVANPVASNKTIVAEFNDGTDGQVYVYVGTKTNTGTEIQKAGLTNGKPYGVKVTGFPVERVNGTTVNIPPAAGTHFDLVDLGNVTNITGVAFNTSSNTALVTKFSRPEDGAWDPMNPADLYFNTTDQLDQVSDGIGIQVGRSRVWKLHFTDISQPELGGTITAVIDGTEGVNMLDNMTIDGKGHILLQEDVGNADHLGKIWQYTISTDALITVAKHDSSRFGNIVNGVPVPATAPFTKDEESSGVLDVSEILGPGMFLTTVQAHYAPATNTAEVVEGGQLLAFFNPASISTNVLNAAADTITACSGTGVALGTPASADNCSVTSVTNNAPATFPVGTTPVIWTVTDGSGNTNTATQIVVITGGPCTTATADPAVGQMNFTTLADVAQSANTLLFTQNYKLKLPFYNLNQVNVVPNGTIKLTIDLGTKMIISPTFNLATAPLSTYFTWTSQNVAGHVILTGAQIADIPADFTGTAIFEVKGSLSCTSVIGANVVITNTLAILNDEDLQNNAATLQYTLPVTLSTTQVNVTCNGAANGVINVVSSPGTTVVIRNVSNTVVGNTNLAPGVYTVTATATGDTPPGNTCTGTTTVTIVQPLVLTAAVSSVVNNGCNGGNTGGFTVGSTGGTAPYQYTITGPTVNTTGLNSGIFTGLLAGSYVVTSTDANGCTATANATVAQPTGIAPDISLGSDITGSFFGTSGVTQTIVYNISEIAGNVSVGDTLRLTRVAGFSINFNVASNSTIVGGTTYTLDNSRWKIDNSDPAFVSIILTNPANPATSGILSCRESVNVSVTLTRNTTDVSTFTLSARLRKSNGELNLNNNLNSIILTAE